MSDELEGLNEEGMAALKELQAEGHDVKGMPKDEPKPAETPVEAKKDEPKPKEDPKPEVKPKEEEPKKDEGDKPEEKNGDNDEEKPKSRKPVYVPVAKFNETRKELQATKAALAERDAAIAKLQANPTPANKQEAIDAVKELVGKGYSEAEAAELVKIIKSVVPQQTIDPETAKRFEALDRWEKSRVAEEAKMAEQKEQLAFDQDFQNVAKEFPQLADLKKQVHEKAYSEGYERTPLRAIAIELMHDMGYTGKKSKTAEQGGAGAGGNTEIIDFDNVTEEQFARFTPKQMDDFNKFQKAKEQAARR